MCRSKWSLWPHQTVTKYIEKWWCVLFQVTMMERCLLLMRWCQFWNMLESHHQVFTVILCTGMQCTFYCRVAHRARNCNVSCWTGLPKWSILQTLYFIQAVLSVQGSVTLCITDQPTDQLTHWPTFRLLQKPWPAFVLGRIGVGLL